MAKPILLMAMIVGLLSLITMITCFFILSAAFIRSGVSSTGNYPMLGGLWRLWHFAGSSDFVHPQRGMIAAGLYGSVLLLFLSVIGGSIAGSAVTRAAAGAASVKQSDKR